MLTYGVQRHEVLSVVGDTVLVFLHIYPCIAKAFVAVRTKEPAVVYHGLQCVKVISGCKESGRTGYRI